MAGHMPLPIGLSVVIVGGVAVGIAARTFGTAIVGHFAFQCHVEQSALGMVLGGGFGPGRQTHDTGGGFNVVTVVRSCNGQPFVVGMKSHRLVLWKVLIVVHVHHRLGGHPIDCVFGFVPHHHHCRGSVFVFALHRDSRHAGIGIVPTPNQYIDGFLCTVVQSSSQQIDFTFAFPIWYVVCEKNMKKEGGKQSGNKVENKVESGVSIGLQEKKNNQNDRSSQTTNCKPKYMYTNHHPYTTTHLLPSNVVTSVYS